MDMSANVQNGYMSSRISVINSHTLLQCKKPSNLNYINWGFKNGNVSGGHFYMNSHNVYEANNHKSVDSTKKSDENNHNRSEMENNGL